MKFFNKIITGIGFWFKEVFYLLTRPTTVGVKAVVMSDNGRILLVRQSFGLSKKPRWTLPGGSVQSSEHIDQALSRELKEEANLTVLNSELLAVYRRAKHGKTGYTLVFLIKQGSWQGQLRAGNEIEDIGFFFPADLPTSTFSHIKKALAELPDSRESKVFFNEW